MYDLDRQTASRPGAQAHDVAGPVPGKSSGTDGMLAKAAPLADDAEWEDLEMLPAPPSEALRAAEDDDGDDDGKDVDEEPEVEAKASAASSSPKPNKPKKKKKAKFNPYAGGHNKEIKNYKYGKKAPEISNTVGLSLGRADTYGKAKDFDGRISVDIGTVVGGKPKKFTKGWAFVYHVAVNKKPGKKAQLRPSGDHTGWVRVGKLPKQAKTDIAKRQMELRKELAKGKGPGHEAKTKGKKFTFAISGSELITDKANPGFIDFRIKGAGKGTPLGNYTLRPDQYGQVIVGTWNPPGSTNKAGKKTSGSGGVRAFLPLTTKMKETDVPAHTVTSINGVGTSTWIYVEARVNGANVFLWVMKDWSITEQSKDANGQPVTKTATGQNF